MAAQRLLLLRQLVAYFIVETGLISSESENVGTQLFRCRLGGAELEKAAHRSQQVRLSLQRLSSASYFEIPAYPPL